MQPPQAHLPNSRTINILLLTGDSVASRVPQAVFLPPLLFATVQQDVAVHPLNQHLLYFHANDNLESQETVEADVLAANQNVACYIRNSSSGTFVPGKMLYSS
jgi:hypothetical protein